MSVIRENDDRNKNIIVHLIGYVRWYQFPYIRLKHCSINGKRVFISRCDHKVSIHSMYSQVSTLILTSARSC